MHEYTLLRLTDSDELNQDKIDDLAKSGWIVQHVIPPAHYAGSSHVLVPARLFARDASKGGLTRSRR